MEDPIKMDDLGGKPTIFGNIQIRTDGCLHVHASGSVRAKNKLVKFFINSIDLEDLTHKMVHRSTPKKDVNRGVLGVFIA